jgi:hypothetical protein
LNIHSASEDDIHAFLEAQIMSIEEHTGEAPAMMIIDGPRSVLNSD